MPNSEEDRRKKVGKAFEKAPLVPGSLSTKAFGKVRDALRQVIINGEKNKKRKKDKDNGS